MGLENSGRSVCVCATDLSRSQALLSHALIKECEVPSEDGGDKCDLRCTTNSPEDDTRKFHTI